ncbi:MAG: hypothetical protein Q4D81_15145 [Eubacteriales bacterium]|nr:hypothetical protein [Eubacteriales bacterium]
MENNLFEIALREKYRYSFKGQISTEDLWDLSVENLDAIFKGLNDEVAKSSRESLLAKESKDIQTLRNKIEIIRYIVAYKLNEVENRKKAAANKAKKQRILEIINKKQDESLQGKSVDELLAMLDELDENT